METMKEKLLRAAAKKEILHDAVAADQAYHVAFSGTSNYLVHTGVAMTSILLSNPGQPFCFHLFINGIEPDDKRKMKELAETHRCGVILYYVDDSVFQEMLHSDGIAAFFYRFLIPLAAEKEGIARILYLDGDMMCQGDLAPLMEMDLEGNIAACTEDTSPAYAEMRRRRVGTKAYFNSGMMMIEVARWNAAEVSQKAAAMAVERRRSGARLHSHDQDILNILLDGRFKEAGRKYNAIYNMDMKSFFQHQEPLRYDPEAVIIHFAGIVKPWRTWVQDLPGAAMYARFREASPWKDIPLQGIRGHKDLHQAARHARRMKKYGRAFLLYEKYFAGKLFGGR